MIQGRFAKEGFFINAFIFRTKPNLSDQGVAFSGGKRASVSSSIYCSAIGVDGKGWCFGIAIGWTKEESPGAELETSTCNRGT